MMGAIQRKGVADGCRDLAEVVQRYERLDRLFDEAMRNGRIAAQSEHDPWAFRELGGVVFHIGPGAEPFFGRIGQHRLAMALILDFRTIPAALGGVHVEALPFLDRLRPAPKK